MIPAYALSGWRQQVPWIEDYQVEQDLIISRALISLYNNSEIKSSLAFRGGTALQKLYLQPGARYSEDIDMVQIRQEPIGITIDQIREALIWLGEPARKITERGAKLIYKFTTNNNEIRKLKIEINTTEHYNYYDLIDMNFQVDSPWFKGEAAILTYNINELIGTKLRALYQRRKGRDLFDLWIVLKKEIIDCKNVVDVFLGYCKYNNCLVTRALFERNMLDKCKNNDFKTDIENLIPHGINWSFEEAIDLVHDRIISLLPGEPLKIDK